MLSHLSLSRLFLVALILSTLVPAMSIRAGQKTKKSTLQYLEDLKNYDNTYLQREACLYLGQNQIGAAVDPLLALAKSTEADKFVRASAITAMASIGVTGEIAQTLVQIAQESKEPEIHYAFLTALIDIEAILPEEEKRAFLTVVENSQDTYLRDLAQKFNDKWKKTETTNE